MIKVQHDEYVSATYLGNGAFSVSVDAGPFEVTEATFRRMYGNATADMYIRKAAGANDIAARAKAFVESINTAAEEQGRFMDFGGALRHVRKQGARVAREGWNGTDMCIELVKPFDKVCLPYLEIRDVEGRYHPWAAPHTDLLAEDWYVVK